MSCLMSCTASSAAPKVPPRARRRGATRGCLRFSRVKFSPVRKGTGRGRAVASEYFDVNGDGRGTRHVADPADAGAGRHRVAGVPNGHDVHEPDIAAGAVRCRAPPQRGRPLPIEAHGDQASGRPCRHRGRQLGVGCETAGPIEPGIKRHRRIRQRSRRHGESAAQQRDEPIAVSRPASVLWLCGYGHGRCRRCCFGGCRLIVYLCACGGYL